MQVHFDNSSLCDEENVSVNSAVPISKMVSTRRTARADSFNRKMNTEQAPKILKQLPKPSSVPLIFLMVALHLCKKIIFFNTNIRVLAYFTCLFAVSGIADILPFPKIMFLSYTNNFVNQYFVKLGWFWTLFVSIPFVFMTSATYCCGKKEMLFKHLARLSIATIVWFFWVSFFVYFESVYGYCLEKRDLKTKFLCVNAGSRWRGFDLSGHVFILIYSNLVLIEEARPILGWEGIQDLIRDEDHARSNKLSTFGPLRNLNTNDFSTLQAQYARFLPYIRVYFILITLLSITWDFMLFSTILYFHSMPEKLMSGFIAIGMWFMTYRLWYKRENLLPLAPGDGSFQYFVENEKPALKKQLSRKNSIPKFMGMPLTQAKSSDSSLS